MKSTQTIERLTSLFVIILMIDPSDGILKLKMPLFILLVLLLLIYHKNVSFKAILAVLIIYAICLFTNTIGLIRGVNTDLRFALGVYKGFTMTILLLWSNRLRFLEYLTFPTIIVSFIVLTIFIFTKIIPEIGGIIYNFTNNEIIPIKISTRNFIGFEILSVFYLTSPLSIFVAGVFLQKLTKGEGNKLGNLFIFACAISILILSGTRMNILSAIVIIGFILIWRMWKTRYGKLLAVVITFFGSIAVMLIISKLLNDTGEQSLEVKLTLAEAFNIQLSKDPWLLFFGEGPGATFDSLGVRGKLAVQSELTYLDLIRWFGIPFTIIILLIYLYPIKIIYSKRKDLEYASVLIVAYLLYMVIAGSNPLLITSTGMLALLIMYTYALNPYYENNNQEIIKSYE